MIQKYRFWLAASILVAIIFSLSGFSLAFETPYTVQDDARQHVFWLQRLNDSDLFKEDLIADYFSSVAPAGYKALYWLANTIGIKPFVFNKILPVFLGIGSTVYLFFLTTTIYPVPLAGFLATLFLNQNLWMLDDLSSGTPRAFFYVLFIGFSYYLVRQELLPCLLMIILQGLFYPQIVLIVAGILAINLITKKRTRNFYLFCLAIAIAILVTYKLQSGEFSQVISLETAKQLPEFYYKGRSDFFLDNPFVFWLTARRSGFFPYEWQYFLLCLAILWLPGYIWNSCKFRVAQISSSKTEIIWQILTASFGLFILSHLLLFKLHLPSRYTQHTWRIVIAINLGIIVALYLQNIWGKMTFLPQIMKSLILAITICLLLYPTYAVQSRPYRLGYVNGNASELYRFLQQQPKDSVIATISKEGDFIPSLAQRSVLVAREYSIPYHWDFYQQIRLRTQDLIQAQYSEDPSDVNQFIQKYNVDLWLLDQNAFAEEYLSENFWLKQFKTQTNRALFILKQDKKPSIVNKIEQCRVLQTNAHTLLNAQCVMNN